MHTLIADAVMSDRTADATYNRIAYNNVLSARIATLGK